MRVLIFLYFFSSAVFSQVPARWSAVTELREVHEFYQSNEVLSKPTGSWQILFSVVYLGRFAGYLKDCVFYRVPGEAEAGALKLKTTEISKNCEDFILGPGDETWPGLKALQFAIGKSEFTLELTHPKYRIERWRVALPRGKRRAKTSSSADFKARPLYFLSEKAAPDQRTALKDGDVCHAVNDDCDPKGVSICNQCLGAWYEVPNGCPQGPKYCGDVRCGIANQPACRRGMRYQRKSEKFDCRIDPSFAYCAKGLKLACEGAQAFCR